MRLANERIKEEPIRFLQPINNSCDGELTSDELIWGGGSFIEAPGRARPFLLKLKTPLPAAVVTVAFTAPHYKQTWVNTV